MCRVTPVVAVAHGAGCPALAAVVEPPLRHPMGNTWAMMRGGAVGQLACLISTKSQVRILSPLDRQVQIPPRGVDWIIN